jgi:hypothetical protein
MDYNLHNNIGVLSNQSQKMEKPTKQNFLSGENLSE